MLCMCEEGVLCYCACVKRVYTSKHRQVSGFLTSCSVRMYSSISLSRSLSLASSSPQSCPPSPSASTTGPVGTRVLLCRVLFLCRFFLFLPALSSSSSSPPSPAPSLLPSLSLKLKIRRYFIYSGTPLIWTPLAGPWRCLHHLHLAGQVLLVLDDSVQIPHHGLSGDDSILHILLWGSVRGLIIIIIMSGMENCIIIVIKHACIQRSIIAHPPSPRHGHLEARVRRAFRITHIL